MMLLLQTVSLRGFCIGLERVCEDVIILAVKYVCKGQSSSKGHSKDAR